MQLAASFMRWTGGLGMLFSFLLSCQALASPVSLEGSVAYHQARARMVELTAKFRANSAFYTSRKFNEAQTRALFIDEFFSILGWDVRNGKQVFLYQQEVVPEARLKIGRTMRYADYAFRLGGRTVLFVEAKAAHQSLENPKHIFQAKRYAFSSMPVELAVLTDFEEFRVFDARIRPDIGKPDRGLMKIFSLHYRDYPANFDRLWKTFSRKAVMGGSIDRLLLETDPGRVRITADQAFVKDLDRARLLLGQDLYANNPGLTEERLNRATLHTLNQLVFSRILEDRGIEPTGRLRSVLNTWNQSPEKTLSAALAKEFERFQKRYNGVIFRPHFSDDFTIGDAVLEKIILNLYPPRSPYILAMIPVSVLGEAYEQHLARRLEIKKGQVFLSKRPQVRKAGGVFYTPEWITGYIVSRTLGPKLKGKAPTDLGTIKTLDPACGSGAFTVEVARRLMAYARDYYARHPETIQGLDTEFPDAYRLPDGRYKLSVRKKAELIQDSIFCVDVDPKAVEITKFWLYVLMLEEEGSYIVTEERKYKVLYRVWPEKIENFTLPSLDQNVVWGNALVGPDFSTDPAERMRIRAFDWQKDNLKIAAILERGGFDVVVGNPPYLSTRSMNRVIPGQYAYLRTRYKSLSEKQPDLSFGFVEKGVDLLNRTGRLGYIITNRFLYNEAGENLRRLIADGRMVEEIINFGPSPIFEGVDIATATLILNRSGNATFKYAKVHEMERPERILGHLDANSREEEKFFVRTIPVGQLSRRRWGFAPPSRMKLLEAMEGQPLRLRDVAESFVGVKTGANNVFIVTILKEDGNKALIFSKETNRRHWIEKETLRPLMRSRDVVRHRPLRNKSWLVWAYNDKWEPLPETILETSFPLAHAYLLENQEKLRNRGPVKSGRATWYGLEVPGNSNIMQKPKLVTGWKGRQTAIGIDRYGDMFMVMTGMSAAIVPMDGAPTLEALLGLLGSAAARTFVETYSPEFSGGDPILPPTILDTIPIVPLTPESTPLYQAIGEKVKMILALPDTPAGRKRQKSLEAEIDTLVEELYGVKTARKRKAA